MPTASEQHYLTSEYGEVEISSASLIPQICSTQEGYYTMRKFPRQHIWGKLLDRVLGVRERRVFILA